MQRRVRLPHGDGSLELEGVLIEAGPLAAVVAPPHPLYGGSLDNHVVAEIVAALSEAGLTTLAFNWRGVGASTGVPSGDVNDAAADYTSALTFLSASVAPPFVAAGYSFGAATALQVAAGGASVSRLVLVAPPPAMLASLDCSLLTMPVRAAVGDSDEFAPAAELGRWLAALDDARLEVVVGADHFFFGPELPELAARLRTTLD